MYKPKPIDISDMILSEELLALTEKIVENVYDVWVVSRIAEGWTYGDIKKYRKESDTTACAI